MSEEINNDGLATEKEFGKVRLANVNQTYNGELRDNWAISPFTFSRTIAKDDGFGVVQQATINDVERGDLHNGYCISPRTLNYYVNKKWDIQETQGTGKVARMSEVDAARNNIKWGDPNDTSSSDIWPRWAVNGRELILVHQRSGNFYIAVRGTGSNPNTSNTHRWTFPSKSGTVALTSDIPKVSPGLGYNQRWMGVSRASGTNYRNTTGSPIMASIFGHSNSHLKVEIWVDGMKIVEDTNGGHSTKSCGVSAIVPPNSTYQYRFNRSVTIRELR